MEQMVFTLVGSLFNARASAGNFSNDDLKKAIEYCTLRNVKTHLTLNTLIKDSEFDSAFNLAKYAYECGIDYLIVQDIGLARYLIKSFPDLPIHASTQMSIHNLEGVKKAEELGFKRVVLARELSVNEIEHICNNSNIEIEAFIHGALCISYSGQCLFSSLVGGRSGNRGKCAQPCRLPYELISKDLNSKTENILNKGFLLSPRDLCGLEYIPALIDAGVKCFKIEGRMKSPDYVATVTRIYRKYIDMYLNNKDYIIDSKDKKDLMQVFNRGGFSSGHLDNNPNNELIFKEKPNNMGIYLGNVCNYNKNKGYITLILNEDLSIGDTISFENENTKYKVSELMIGNTNFSTCEVGKKVIIGRMKGKIANGDKIYKISSNQLTQLAEKSYKNVENRKIPLSCEITIKKNQPIHMKIFAKIRENTYNISVSSQTIPIQALKTPLAVERVIKQISKTNNTPYEFKNIKVFLDNELYIPSISALNELRRTALQNLEQEILENKRRKADNVLVKNTSKGAKEQVLEKPKISLFLRNLVKAYEYSKLDKNKIDRIYLPLKLFVNKNYYQIIYNLSQSYDIYVYMPTIIKNNYKNIILNDIDNIIQKFHVKGFVLSNISDFKFLEKYSQNYDFVGNYSLNVFNRFHN